MVDDIVNDMSLQSFDPGGVAMVIGATGGIGAALLEALTDAQHFSKCIGLSQDKIGSFEDLDSSRIEKAVRSATAEGEIRLAIDATGFLSDESQGPEKSWRDLDPSHLARYFAINAIGPAILMKYLLPSFPRTGKSMFASLSARVGSIDDNRLGGWYGYRASKTALNQIVRTASIELARRAPEAVCVALHPGTVATPLSAPFAGTQRTLHTPSRAAFDILNVADQLKARSTGGFFDWRLDKIPW